MDVLKQLKQELEGIKQKRQKIKANISELYGEIRRTREKQGATDQAKQKILKIQKCILN